MHMQSEQQQRIMGYFIEEAKDHLNTIEQGLLNLQSTIEDSEMVSEVFRAAHSVKGGAAMLGLTSIQRTAHRLEDYFKVLKECPVKVDQKLETLFLRLFDTLQELLDQLQGPFGLTDDKSDEIMGAVEPVFGQLNEHLKQLVDQAGGVPPDEVDLAPVSGQRAAAAVSKPAPPVVAAPPPVTARAPQEERGALHLIFQSDIPARLRDMLQLFKQPDQPDTRQQLQDICQSLVGTGEQFDLQPWCDLLTKARRAIACPDNSYKTLAPILIKEIKRAQELVLAGQVTAIVCSEGLEALIPEELPEEPIALDEVQDDEFDRLFADQEADDSNVTLDLIGISNEPSGGIEFPEDLMGGDDWLTAGEDSVDELTPEDEDAWFEESPGSSDGLGEEMIQDDWDAALLSSPPAPALPNDADLGFDDLDEEPMTPAKPSRDSIGPGVGNAELKSLADLFDNQPGDLSSIWDETEEILPPMGDDGDDGLDLDETKDFSDLLSDQPPATAPIPLFSSDVDALGDLLDISEASADREEASLADDLTEDNPDLDDLLDITPAMESHRAESAPGQLPNLDLSELDDLWGADNGAPAVGELNTLNTFFDEMSDDQAIASDLFDISPSEAPFESVPSLPDRPSELGDNGFGGGAISSDLDEWFELDLETPATDVEGMELETFEMPEETPDLGEDNLWNALSDTEIEGVGLDQADLADETLPTEFDSLFDADTLDFPTLVEMEPELGDVSSPDLPNLDTSALEDMNWFTADPEVESHERSSPLSEDLFAAETLGDVDALFGSEDSAEPLDERAAIDEALDLGDLDLDLDLDHLMATAPEESSELDLLEINGASGVDEAAASVRAPADEFALEFPETELAGNLDDLFLESPDQDLELAAIASDDIAFDLDADFTAPSDSEITDLDALLEDAPDLPDFPDYDTFVQGENDDVDLDNFEGLIDESATAGEDFSDLDALLDDHPVNEHAPPGEMEQGGDTFDDLEALLDDGPIVSAPSVAPAIAEVDEFADLEAMLDEPSAVADRGGVASAGDSFADEFDDLEKLLEDADQTMGGGGSSKTSRRSPAAAAARRQPRRTSRVHADQTMRVSVKNLDNLNNLIGELVVNRNSLEQTQERLRQFLDNLLYQVQQLSDVGQRMRDLYERSLLESSLLSSRKNYQPHTPGHGGLSAQSHATGANFDALEMDRFTGFHTLSQEMIELIVRVRESASDIDFVVDESDQITRTFRQVTTQLQEGLTRARMVPFAQTADRLPRAVRDISLKCGKQAELVVEGRDTLIDKMILEQLYDPMTHLVNNAITHGVETPEERIASGKNPTGRITIRTFHQGNQTVISISDDGAGIDPERVKRKALEKGVITPDEAREMSRLDVYDLLFHSGFSTRDKADDFAGRGVGMDVVRTNLNEIRGTISTDSTIGKGTTFTIRLPLTLSISKALCCISNRARIAFPMDGVEDMLDVPRDRIQTDEEGRSCILWREMLLPFQPLQELLAYNRVLGRGSVYGGNQEEDMISVVVLRSAAGNFLALQVDQVLGEQEIVIKQLEGPVPKPTGIAGATVLGDGRIMPIADVLELIDLSMGRIRRDGATTLWQKDEIPTSEIPAQKSEPTVLIVDDSITVRELLSMTFNKVGYRVEQARDGQEAWEKLRSGLPCDLVFCDIEMPRMDGLELLSRIQKDATLAHIPIAMLTSRGADRHRQMAVTLGAKGYFTKPYLEEVLLDAAQRMLKGEVLVSTASNA